MRLIYIYLIAVTVIIIACNKEQVVNNTENPANVELKQNIVDFTSKTMSTLSTWDVLTVNNDFIIGSVSYDVNTESYSANTNYEQVDMYLETKFNSNDILTDGLQIVEGHLYLYFSIGDTAFAEDVNIQIVQGTLAGLQFGSGESHSCDGSCGGNNSILTKCNSCEFERTNGKITGCKCSHSPGFCCHTITSTSESEQLGGQ